MLTFRRLFLIILTGLVLAYLVPQLAAQEPNRAALVVRMEDGSVQTSCVEFPEAQITGYDLLQRSGLDVTVDVQGMGALVCSIEDTGCPANDCLCQCRGGECQYWSYWHQIDGEWLYSRAGAMAYPVLDGAVEGWSWGPGSVTDAVVPSETTFASVCQDVPAQTTSNTAVLAADKRGGEDTAVAFLPYFLFAFILFIPALLIWRTNRQTELS